MENGKWKTGNPVARSLRHTRNPRLGSSTLRPRPSPALAIFHFRFSDSRPPFYRPPASAAAVASREATIAAATSSTHPASIPPLGRSPKSHAASAIP